MIGKFIHNYQVTARLGEGGMGIVYKASDTVLGRDVALKMLHAQLIRETQFLERFRKEARVLAQLLHPNIAVIYNFIEQEDNFFMVMEYVEGKNLDELLRQHQQLSYEAVVAAFIQALEGLHHAHKKGIYHRDIKPSNLILTPDGTVKLMDFGIAKIAGEQRLTQVNRVVGTIEFMAPELIEGKDPSMASDIYAAGVTMYELLTGRLPFEGNTDYNLMQDILKKKPLSVDKLNAAVPKQLSAIVMQALEKKPEQRYPHAKAFQQALAAAYPHLKEIDFNKIQAPRAAAPATQVIRTMAGTGQGLAATRVSDKPTNATNRIYSTLRTAKQQVAARINKPVLIGIAVVFLLLVSALIFWPSGEKKLAQDGGDNGGGPGPRPDSVLEAANSGGSGITTYNTPKQPETKPDNPAFGPVDKGGEVNNKEKNKPSTVKEKEPDKSKEPVKKDIPAEEKKITPPPEVLVPDKKEETVITETPRKKSVSLDSRLEVNLYLNDAINPEAAKQGQSLSFSVTSPVMYNGDIIIARGASASGRIKSISNKKMSIVINSVTAVSGQRLSFQEVELSGRISEILSSRNYSATLKKGVTINL